MMITWWMGILSGIILLAAGALLTFFQGWFRTIQARKKAEADKEKREAADLADQMKKLTAVVENNTFMIESTNDRVAAASRAVLAIATACKNGTPALAEKAIDLVSASEDRFLTALTNRMTKKPETVPDLEEVPE